MSADYTWGHDVAQWIENSDVTGDGQDDHIYGRLKRNVVSVTARTTYAFTRDMTLEVYLQPFVAVGDYTDIRRLARPNSFDFEPAVIETNPDFNSKSLRSNVVFRWEYMRGSSLFVVWNVSNADDTRPGVFTPFRDLRSGFGAAGTAGVHREVELLAGPVGHPFRGASVVVGHPFRGASALGVPHRRARWEGSA